KERCCGFAKYTITLLVSACAEARLRWPEIDLRRGLEREPRESPRAAARRGGFRCLLAHGLRCRRDARSLGRAPRGRPKDAPRPRRGRGQRRRDLLGWVHA